MKVTEIPKKRPGKVESVMSLYDRLCFAYEGGLTERFHTRSGVKTSTDAHHSHGVAMLCFFLSEGLPSANLLMEALTHDLAEQHSGDLPAPGKWALGAERTESHESSLRSTYDLLFPLTKQERRTLEIADALEGVLWCANELSLGNQKAKRAGNKWLTRISQRYKDSFTQKESDLLVAVVKIWTECGGDQNEQCTKFDVYADAERK